MSEEQVEEQVTETEPDPQGQIRSFLDQIPGGPSKETVEAWKAAHGDVYVSAFSDTEVFIFRSLNRAEFRSLQEVAAQEGFTEMEYQDKTVHTCVLWTSVANVNAKAGTIPTLTEQIMQNSNFVTPNIAATMVAKL